MMVYTLKMGVHVGRKMVVCYRNLPILTAVVRKETIKFQPKYSRPAVIFHLSLIFEVSSRYRVYQISYLSKTEQLGDP